MLVKKLISEFNLGPRRETLQKPLLFGQVRPRAGHGRVVPACSLLELWCALRQVMAGF